jgi:hypothetical protein
MQTPTIGRIVIFFPNKNENGLKLPNGMESAPAMLVQIFDKYSNLNVFTAETKPELSPVKTAWSICHKDDIKKDENGELLPGVSYWDWPNIVK